MRRLPTRRLHRWAAQLEEPLDRLRQRVDRRFPSRAGFAIVPYLGFGNGDKIWQHGRVLEGKRPRRSVETDAAWHNLLQMYRRFETDEVPGALVLAEASDVAEELVTDEEGYFLLEAEAPREGAIQEPWVEVDYHLLDPEPVQPVSARGKVLMPARSSTLAVISDVDDTIVRTNATDRLMMLRTVAFSNARRRIPFEGASALYTALYRGVGGNEGNPIFYLSSSPWNLYDLLEEFLDIAGFPLGPLLLQDYGFDAERIIHAGHDGHKLGWVRRIMDVYPQLPFVLIGDSGQRDPEIYAQIAEERPDQVRVIYIRDALRGDTRDRSIETLAARLDALGVEIRIVADSVAAARHAVDRGWIDAAELRAVGEQRRDDAAAKEALDEDGRGPRGARRGGAATSS